MIIIKNPNSQVKLQGDFFSGQKPKTTKPDHKIYSIVLYTYRYAHIYRVFFFTGPPPKKLKYGKPRLGEVRCI